jgi:hypothetical protein
MPYTAEISRNNPSCFLFLIDQSDSMKKPFGSQPDKSKADGVADAINRLLQNLSIKCAKSDGIRDYFHVGVIGYGSTAAPALGGVLAGQGLVPISSIANNPLRVEQRNRVLDDGAGGLIQQSFKFPVWFEPKANGKTAMCQALDLAHQLLQIFLSRYPGCYPPLVLNITDGKPTDGDPRPHAKALTALASTDGNVLLFNAHIASTPAPPVAFPDDEAILPDNSAKLLYRISSPLPPKLQTAAQGEGYKPSKGGTMRGCVFNGDLVSVIRFLDIGTRVAQQAR